LEDGHGYVFDVQRILDRQSLPPRVTLERL
jgi:hypothetical protein